MRIERVISGSAWAVDVAFRDRLLTWYQASDDLWAVWAGRHGPELDDERIVASVWADADGESRAPSLATLIDAAEESRPQHPWRSCPSRSMRSSRDPTPLRFVRVYHGQTRLGEADGYVRMRTAVFASMAPVRMVRRPCA